MEKSSPGACPSILYLNAAFRELALGLPAAFAVVAFKDDVAWSRVRVRTFAALAAEAGVPCSVFPPPGSVPGNREADMARWVATLPRRRSGRGSTGEIAE